jgi:hypothetical protein
MVKVRDYGQGGDFEYSSPSFTILPRIVTGALAPVAVGRGASMRLAGNRIMLSVPKGAAGTVRVLDTRGRSVIRTAHLRAGTHTIDATGLARGLYVVRARIGSFARDAVLLCK